MKALLADTHALIWFARLDPRLSERALAAIQDGENLVFASVASVWEIGLKVARGKLDLGTPPEQFVRGLLAQQIRILPIQLRHTFRATALPPHHGDPFDRMLVGQALEDGLTLVTCDPQMPAYGVPILW